jgi:hypothetical protein
MLIPTVGISGEVDICSQTSLVRANVTDIGGRRRPRTLLIPTSPALRQEAP